MNREIKFRAWDKINEEWLCGYEFKSLGGFSLFGEVMSLGEWSNVLNKFLFHGDLNDLVVMQFTGLRDKNGKEIYEGDIVRRWCGGEEFCARNKMTGTIEWRDTEFWVNGHDRKIKVRGGSSAGQMVDMSTVHSWMGMHSCMRNGELEVIGNIYENPELIQ